jgi:hypothetical protein
MVSTTLALCDAGDSETAAPAKVHLPAYAGRDEVLSPLAPASPE